MPEQYGPIQPFPPPWFHSLHQCAVTSLCNPVACWCTLNEARCTKPPANQPSSLSPASQVIALTPWLPTHACCVQSTPANPMTRCSCHPTAALSLVGIFKEHCPDFLWHWGCPGLPSYCTGYKEGCAGSVSGRSRPRGPQKAWPLAQWCCSWLPAGPPTAYLQHPPGNDLGDGNPTINFAVSLDLYRTLFYPPNWHLCLQHAFALAFPMPFLFLLLVLLLLLLSSLIFVLFLLLSFYYYYS